MNDLERTVLAALADLQDGDTNDEPTAEAVARRARVKFPVASAVLERLLGEGLVAHRARAHFPAVRMSPPAESARYTITRKGRHRLAE
jgi:hypothetical protein